MKKIVLDKTMPKTRNECEIAGYRDVLNTIHENFNHISIRDTFILQLHRDLYEYEAFVEQVDKSKVVVKKALGQAQLLFDSLMQEYFG